MVKFNCILLFFICPLIYLAQKVNNIEASQLGQNIVVTYDLETEQPCTINLFISTNGGTTWQGPLKQVQGQVGPNIKSGQNSITLFVLTEFNELRGDNIRFKVDALTNNLNTIKIGTQTWTTKNLDVTTYRNGDAIPQVQDANAWANLRTGAWCYYENKTGNGSSYGKLYNWYAVNDPRGLAPKGYHIPTDEDWTILSENLVGTPEAGTKMKSTSGWKNNGNGTNTSGFAGLPGGYRFDSGNFNGIGAFGYWWSSSAEGSEYYAWHRDLGYNNGFVYRNVSYRRDGFSVRCIKDATTNNLNTIKIGTQTWTTKNLDVTTYRNGDVIPQVQDANAWANLRTGAWCYYENNTANGSSYGKLYNWYAVNDPRGLAPKGYHIPRDAEWTILSDNLGDEAGNGTNTIGFEGLPGGYLDYNGDFDDIGANGYWWSSSEYNSNIAWCRNLNYSLGNVYRDYYNKHYGFSVRCLRD